MIDTLRLEVIDNGIILEDKASTIKEAATFNNDPMISSDNITKLIGRNVWSQINQVLMKKKVKEFPILIHYDNKNNKQ